MTRTSTAAPSWRESWVVEQRARGRTYGEIADELRISRQRVHQLWNQWHDRERRQQVALLTAAQHEAEHQAQLMEYRAWRRRVDELVRVATWMRHRGGADAFAAFAACTAVEVDE